MTQEGQGPTPDETPRPVTTRWSEDPLPSDDELAPPFVPDRGPRAEPAADEAEPWAPATGEGGPETAGVDADADEAHVPEEAYVAEDAHVPDEATPADREEGVAVGVEDDGSFPFDAAEDRGVGPEEAEPASVAGEAFEEGGEEYPPYEPEETTPADDAAVTGVAFESGMEPEEGEDLVADRGDFLPGEGGPDTASEDPVAAQPGPDGWEPFGADEGLDETPEIDAPYTAARVPADAEAGAPDTEDGQDAEVEAGAVSAVDEVADLLDRLARRVREEGAGVLQAEMQSDDRLTSLVAGLLAGYVSGRS